MTATVRLTIATALAGLVAGLAGCSTAEPPRATPEPTSAVPSTTSPPSPSPSPSGSAGSASGSAGPTGPPTPPAYRSSISRIGPELRQRMRFSHRPGCPVPLRDLRHLRVGYVGFDGEVRQGELVVHADVAEDVATVFGRLYDARFPIRRMRLVDEYTGDDDRSMAANNTSAYNCRRVAGSDSWSEHAYGRAIDVNPVQNPYVRDGSVAPPSGRRFADLDRSSGASPPRGAVHAGGPAVSAFAAIGWEWGGNWQSAKDYQHFSASGR